MPSVLFQVVENTYVLRTVTAEAAGPTTTLAVLNLRQARITSNCVPALLFTRC